MAFRSHKKYQNLTFELALEKLERYCAWQERCSYEVRCKLRDLKAPKSWDEKILRRLMIDNFLDDWRFTELFVRSKFNQKKWGRNKIRNGLIEKRIKAPMILKGLNTLDEELYSNCLNKLISTKSKLLLNKEPDTFQRRAKLIRYLRQKGFETEIIFQHLKT